MALYLKNSDIEGWLMQAHKELMQEMWKIDNRVDLANIHHACLPFFAVLSTLVMKSTLFNVIVSVIIDDADNICAIFLINTYLVL